MRFRLRNGLIDDVINHQINGLINCPMNGLNNYDSYHNWLDDLGKAFLSRIDLSYPFDYSLQIHSIGLGQGLAHLHMSFTH